MVRYFFICILLLFFYFRGSISTGNDNGNKVITRLCQTTSNTSRTIHLKNPLDPQSNSTYSINIYRSKDDKLKITVPLEDIYLVNDTVAKDTIGFYLSFATDLINSDANSTYQLESDLSFVTKKGNTMYCYVSLNHDFNCEILHSQENVIQYKVEQNGKNISITPLRITPPYLEAGSNDTDNDKSEKEGIIMNIKDNNDIYGSIHRISINFAESCKEILNNLPEMKLDDMDTNAIIDLNEMPDIKPPEMQLKLENNEETEDFNEDDYKNDTINQTTSEDTYDSVEVSTTPKQIFDTYEIKNQDKNDDDDTLDYNSYDTGDENSGNPIAASHSGFEFRQDKNETIYPLIPDIDSSETDNYIGKDISDFIESNVYKSNGLESSGMSSGYGSSLDDIFNETTETHVVEEDSSAKIVPKAEVSGSGIINNVESGSGILSSTIIPPSQTLSNVDSDLISTIKNVFKHLITNKSISRANGSQVYNDSSSQDSIFEEALSILNKSKTVYDDLKLVSTKLPFAKTESGSGLESSVFSLIPDKFSGSLPSDTTTDDILSAKTDFSIKTGDDQEPNLMTLEPGNDIYSTDKRTLIDDESLFFGSTSEPKLDGSGFDTSHSRIPLLPTSASSKSYTNEPRILITQSGSAYDESTKGTQYSTTVEKVKTTTVEVDEEFSKVKTTVSSLSGSPYDESLHTIGKSLETKAQTGSEMVTEHSYLEPDLEVVLPDCQNYEQEALNYTVLMNIKRANHTVTPTNFQSLCSTNIKPAYYKVQSGPRILSNVFLSQRVDQMCQKIISANVIADFTPHVSNTSFNYELFKWQDISNLMAMSRGHNAYELHLSGGQIEHNIQYFQNRTSRNSIILFNYRNPFETQLIDSQDYYKIKLVTTINGTRVKAFTGNGYLFEKFYETYLPLILQTSYKDDKMEISPKEPGIVISRPLHKC